MITVFKVGLKQNLESFLGWFYSGEKDPGTESGGIVEELLSINGLFCRLPIVVQLLTK